MLSDALHQDNELLSLQGSPTVYDNTASSLMVIVGAVESVGSKKGIQLLLSR